MSQITHQKDADGIMRQIVPAHVLRAILDADGDDYTRPDDFGPGDEWDVGDVGDQEGPPDALYEATVRPAASGFGEYQQGQVVAVETDAETIDEYVAGWEGEATERPDVAASMRRWGPYDTRTWRVFELDGMLVSLTGGRS